MDNETAFPPLIAIKLNHETGTKTGYGKLLTVMYKLDGKESTATATATATENDILDLP